MKTPLLSMAKGCGPVYGQVAYRMFRKVRRAGDGGLCCVGMRESRREANGRPASDGSASESGRRIKGADEAARAREIAAESSSEIQ